MYAGFLQQQLRIAIEEALKLDRESRGYRPRSTVVAESQPLNKEPLLFKWESTGEHHALPEGFELTSRGTGTQPPQYRTPMQAYLRWFMPDKKAGICAIRDCSTSDFSDKNQKKRFCDWRIMVKALHQMLRDDGQHVMTTVESLIATVDDWALQFRRAWAVHMGNLLFLHPSKRKREIIRQRPQSALAYKVSTFVSDWRAINRAQERERGDMLDNDVSA